MARGQPNTPRRSSPPKGTFSQHPNGAGVRKYTAQFRTFSRDHSRDFLRGYRGSGAKVRPGTIPASVPASSRPDPPPDSPSDSSASSPPGTPPNSPLDSPPNPLPTPPAPRRHRPMSQETTGKIADLLVATDRVGLLAASGVLNITMATISANGITDSDAKIRIALCAAELVSKHTTTCAALVAAETARFVSNTMAPATEPTPERTPSPPPSYVLGETFPGLDEAILAIVGAHGAVSDTLTITIDPSTPAPSRSSSAPASPLPPLEELLSAAAAQAHQNAHAAGQTMAKTFRQAHGRG